MCTGHYRFMTEILSKYEPAVHLFAEYAIHPVPEGPSEYPPNRSTGRSQRINANFQNHSVTLFQLRIEFFHCVCDGNCTGTLHICNAAITP